MSSARSVGVIYDDKPLVQLRKEDKLANHSSQRNNASEEQPLRQCWGPRNIVALSDKGLNHGLKRPCCLMLPNTSNIYENH